MARIAARLRRKGRMGLLALAGLGVAAGCFIEPDEPPGWRSSCDGDGDCAAEGEACIDGLCQRPCTQATFSEDCPDDAGTFTACFNGVCASPCNPDDSACPSPQTCVSVEVPPEFADFGLSDFAVCGVACDSAHPCPGEELCVEGGCVDPGGLTGGDTGTSETGATGP